jgi:3-hydroxyacyl-CoA dehydrogenase
MSSHEISSVAVIGSGQMGGGIAQISAVAGFDTIVYDTAAPALDTCRATHDKLLARAVEKGGWSRRTWTGRRGGSPTRTRWTCSTRRTS